MMRPEVLAPAGDMERLRAALDFGADAVYLGGNLFGMRQGAPNFNAEALCDGVKLAHSMGKKVYLTVNTLPRIVCFRILLGVKAGGCTKRQMPFQDLMRCFMCERESSAIILRAFQKILFYDHCIPGKDHGAGETVSIDE